MRSVSDRGECVRDVHGLSLLRPSRTSSPAAAQVELSSLCDGNASRCARPGASPPLYFSSANTMPRLQCAGVFFSTGAPALIAVANEGVTCHES